MKRFTFKKAFFLLAFLAFTSTFKPSTVTANPINPKVIAGKATFENPNSSTLNVRTGNRVVINWDSFSINKNEKTKFIQPGKNSAVLNRVTGGSRSDIFGAIDANGRVYLINPNGVLIDKDSQINAAAFLASTLDVSNSDFLNDADMTFSGNSNASVVNLGTINAFDGDVILLGFQVDNQGQIIAPKGTAGIAAGQEILLQVGKDKKFLIRPKQLSGPVENTGVNMSGTIQALAAEIQADGSPYKFAINHTGMIDATGVVSKGGQVYLCSPDGNTCVNGKIVTHGGQAQILGHKVGLLENTIVDTSHEMGGGKVWIGGGYQGLEAEIMNSEMTYVTPSAKIITDATLKGDAGQVVVWSDNTTHFYGNISAKGGPNGGNGGLVEVSGHSVLNFDGNTDRSAPKGKGGTLLLDPRSITITNTNTNSAFTTIPGPTYIFTATNPANPSSVSKTSIGTQLATGDVIVRTQDDGGADIGDIIWEEGFDLTVNTPFDLTLQSVHDIIMSSLYTNTGSGSVFFNAVNDITFQTISSTSPFGISLGTGGINLDGNNININSSPAQFLLTNTGNPFNGNITINALGNFNMKGGSTTGSTAQISSTAGNVYLNVFGGDAFIEGGSADTTSASISGVTDVINVDKGSLYLQGFSALSSVTGASASISGNEVRINTGQDLVLDGGAGTASPAFIFADDEVTVSAGRDVLVRSHAGSGTGANTSSASITGVNGVDFCVECDLSIEAGTAADMYAGIFSSSGDMNFKIGDDVRLLAGSASGTYAQIGSNDTQTANANISFTKIGGNLTLTGTQTPSLTNAYAVIGHGNPSSSPTQFNGNISVSGREGSNITLNGGVSSNTNFAQIGHFGNATAASVMNGDILINGAGQSMNLNPNDSYALVGHGRSTLTNTAVSGDISVNLPGASLTLAGGTAAGSFAQIGQLNFINMLGDGNIDVDLNGGDLLLTAPNLAGAFSIIGPSTTTASLFQGQISVEAGTIELLAGGAVGANTIIGLNGPFTILPSSSITAIAQDNILLQAGVTGLGIDGGNAVIGYQSSATAYAPIDSITVTSNEGNITLVGGGESTPFHGVALIGTQGTLSSVPVAQQPQSEVTVEAVNGLLALYGSPQGQNATIGGTAIITTNANTLPYDLNIDVADLLLVGGPTASFTGNGSAIISSPQNTTITTKNNLELNAQVGISQIQTGRGMSTFTVGKDLLVLGGTITGSIPSMGMAQIGSLLPTNSPAHLVFTNVGGNVIVQGGTNLQNPNPGCYALIGHGQLGTANGTYQGNIVFDHIGGNVTVAAGVGTGAQAQIGHIGSKVTGGNSLQGDIIMTRVDGDVSVTGGIGITVPAIIGHGNPTIFSGGKPIKGSILINAASLEMLGGFNPQSDAVIGFSFGPTDTPFIDSNNIGIVVDDGVTLTSNIGNAYIGYYNPTTAGGNVTVHAIDVEAKAGNIALNGNNNTALIGTVANGISQSNIKITTPQDVVLKCQGGTAAIVNNRTGVGAAYDVSIDPSAIILLSGTGSPGTAYIYSSSNLDIDFSDRLDINFDAANPTTLQTGTAFLEAFDSIFANTDKPSLGSINLQGANSALQNTFIQALNGDVIIGTDHFTGAGAVNVGTASQIGSAVIVAAGNIEANIQGPLKVTAGTPASAAATISAAHNLDIQAEEDIILTGGQTGVADISAGENLLLTTEKTVFVGSNAQILALANFNGNLEIDAGVDIVAQGPNSFISNAGTGNVIANAGRDIDILGAGLSQSGGGDGGIQLAAGRDLSINGFSNVNQTGTGYSTFTAGQNVTVDKSTITTNAITTTFTAGQDVQIQDGSTVTQNGFGELNINAGQDVVIGGSSTVTTAADIVDVKAGKDFFMDTNSLFRQTGIEQFNIAAGIDVLMTDAAMILTSAAAVDIHANQDVIFVDSSSLEQFGSSTFTLSAGEDFIMEDDTFIGTNASKASFTAGQDIFMAGTSQIVQDGSSQFSFNAGEDISMNNAASVVTFAKDASFTAGDDILMSGTSSILQNGNSKFSFTAGEDIALSDSAEIATLAKDAIFTAGDDILMSGSSSILQAGDSKFSFNAGEDVALTDDAEVTTAAKDAVVQAHDDIIMNGNAAFTQTGENSLLFDAGGNIHLFGLSRVTTAAANATFNAGLNVDLDDNTVIDHTGKGVLTVTAVDNIKMDRNARITTTARKADFTAGINIYLDDNAEINFNSKGVQTYKAGQDFIMHDNSMITTSEGTTSIDAFRDFKMTGQTKILSFGDGRLDIHAGHDVFMDDHALIKNNEGEIQVIADYNVIMEDFSRMQTPFSNITVVVDNKYPNPPFLGNGFFFKNDDAELNAPNGTLRIFTSRRPFNHIEGDLNHAPFIPGPLFFSTATEQWHTYFNRAIKGVPFTVFYKDKGKPVFPPSPLTPKKVTEFIAAIREPFQDWRYYDRFYYETLCMNLYNACCQGELYCDMDRDDVIAEYKLLRQLFHNRHTIKYGLPF